MRTALDTGALDRAEGPDPPGPASLVFVGAPSGAWTEEVADLLGAHRHYRAVPGEARFHTDPGGFPDVLRGATSPDLFAWHLRRHWHRRVDWRRLRLEGMHRYLPRRRLDAACAAFLRRFGDEPEAACRQLFFDLLWPLVSERANAGLVERSPDTVGQAPTLASLFPEARFVVVLRDPQRAAAERVGDGLRLGWPRTVDQGLEWWEAEMHRAEAAVAAVEPGRVHAVSLDDLRAGGDRGNRALASLRRFTGLEGGPEGLGAPARGKDREGSGG